MEPTMETNASQAILSALRDPTLFISDAFIDGSWVKKDQQFDVYEPSYGQTLSTVSSVGRDDFKRAIESASRAQKEYYELTTAAQRGELLRKWFNLIKSHAADLATIICAENGKTYKEAASEVQYAAGFVSWFAEEATRSYGDTIPSSLKDTMVMTVKQPVGTCGIITPWNFPAAMITRKVGPALAAGCSVVIKPPSETPHTRLALVKLAVEAGIPARCIQVCPTRDRSASLELVTNSKVAKISFTGSTGVGKMLAELAAKTVKKVSLELGGNAPLIVFDDAGVDLAVEGVINCKFRCSGQTCVCANRILVQKGISESFTAALVARVNQLLMGPGLDAETTQGPLVNEAAVAKVEAHVRDAVSKGAVVETGGSRPDRPGFFYHPTVLSGVTTDMVVATEETFGPLAPIFTFETEDEAVRLANATEFGLAGYFFSADLARALRVAQRLECGMVGVNTGVMSASETPFGGIKESGYGREGSKYGLAEYQVIKAITFGNLQR